MLDGLTTGRLKPEECEDWLGDREELVQAAIGFAEKNLHKQEKRQRIAELRAKESELKAALKDVREKMRGGA